MPEELKELTEDHSNELKNPLEDFPKQSTLIIDADTLAYVAAFQSQVILDGEIKIPQVKEGVLAAQSKLDAIIEATNAKEVYLVFSGPNNYRKQLYPEYKMNRDRSLTPAGLDEIKQELLKIFPGEFTDGYEADDKVVWLKKKNPEHILVAIDKDVLNSIEGRHFNYYEGPNKSTGFIETDRHTALIWKYIQTLTGDRADNIPGLPRVGIKTAWKILGNIMKKSELWKTVLEAYKQKGKTEDEALLTINLVDVHLLQEDGKTIKLHTHEELLKD